MKKYSIIRRTLLLAATAMTAFTSCSDDETLTPLTISSQDGLSTVSSDGREAAATVGPDGGTLRFTVGCDYRWAAASDAELWCTVEQANQKLSVLIDRLVDERAS